MRNVQKVAIIGLDCADPALMLERWLDDLPHVRRLVEHGRSGPLSSCIPPTTVPAWACMATGKDPGALGVYGFRDRRDWSYEDLGLNSNLEIRQPRLWDYAARAGLESLLLGVPQTFPMLRPPRGCMITGCPTPSTSSPFTHPPELAAELRDVVGSYIIDVENFRTPDKPWLLAEVRRMTAQRFKVARHLLQTRSWDVFWMVDMGPDRMHHGFWRYMDPHHRAHPAGDPLERAIRDYYMQLDQELGALLELLDPDNTAIWIVSDHGAKRLDGGFCLNDWLLREGLLHMKSPVGFPRRFSFSGVDWQRTRAWGEGGYCGRIFINKAGREPQGTVAPHEYEAFRDALADRLAALPTPDGRPMNNRVFKPDHLYSLVNGVPPDLIVHFGDLHWRAIGTLGNPDLYTLDYDDGPDDANHALDGLYVLQAPGLEPGRAPARIYDILPTTLDLLGLSIPQALAGESLLASAAPP